MSAVLSPAPIAMQLPGTVLPAEALAIVSEALFGGSVELLDARELSSQQRTQIGPHNRVYLASGAERIACLVQPPLATPVDALPLPLPSLFAAGQLSHALQGLRNRFPHWGFALRSMTRTFIPRDPLNAQPLATVTAADVRSEEGWLAEIARVNNPVPIAAGYHTSPEAALYIAALGSVANDPDDPALRQRFADTLLRMRNLFASVGIDPPGQQ